MTIDTYGEIPSFVVSLLIERTDQRGRLLMGVRSPSQNPRHPGVLSTITQRLPLPIAAHLVDCDSQEFPLGIHRSGIFSLSYVAESIMSRKLGANELFEQGELYGSVSFVNDVTELVDDPLGTKITELTRMITLRVVLQRGAHLLPIRSGSYVRLDWVEKTKVATALARRDALILIPDADPFMVCIHGLCVRSAVAVLHPQA